MDNILQLAYNLPGVDAELVWNKIQATQDNPVSIAALLCPIHPDYYVLAARLKLKEIYNHSKPTFLESIRHFASQLSADFITHAERFKDVENYLHHGNDELFTYPALETLLELFLLKDNEIIERPQYMLMRVAIHLHDDDLKSVVETYNLLSNQFYTHSTPTMMNSGRLINQLSSCFLLPSPTMSNFLQSMEKCRQILSKQGGIGYYFHNIPAKHVVQCAKILNSVTKITDNNTGRTSSCCVYIEPWHSAIFDFLQLKKNIGPEEARARDLFYALWVPDLFMNRVKNDENWSLFCPGDIKPQLHTIWGKQFQEVYEKLEKEGLYKKQVKARDLFREIAITQIETGGPFFLFKDTSNRESPYSQTIEGSNLCTEIIQYASNNEGTAVCNLASISLPRFVNSEGEFDFNLLKSITKTIVRNLNKTIDKTSYPTDCARQNNLLYRPIGIGVQGLADLFQCMRMTFGCSDSRQLNREIFKTIRQAAEEESQNTNKLLIAQMPTATTSIILGNSENIEPVTSNLYVRQTSSGNFIIMNKYLIQDLMKLGMWTQEIHDFLIANRGSVQKLKNFPYCDLYKTAWEISPKVLIEMAAERKEFIDQSQSLNIYLENPNVEILMSLIIYAFDLGLKTGVYYLRTKPGSFPIQYSLDCKMCQS